MDIYDFLKQLDITYERMDHPPVYTTDQAALVRPDFPGFPTKNLFLRNKKGDRHILVVVGHEKRVDLKILSSFLDERLSFASPERLKSHLGVEPGSVTILGLVNDAAHAVELIVDQEVWDAPAMQCHPLVNTATVAIAKQDMIRFLEATGHKPRCIVVPAAT